MNTLIRWSNTIIACCKYRQYRRTGSLRALREAEMRARRIGEMDLKGNCPALFQGNSILEREWASGRGPEFFYNWMVRKGRFEASA